MADFLDARKFWLFLVSGIQDFARGFSGGGGGGGAIVGVEHMFIKNGGATDGTLGFGQLPKITGMYMGKRKYNGYLLSKL